MNTTPQTHRVGSLQRGIALLAACASIFSGSAWANPTGAQIANGQATLVTSGSELVITNTPGTVINWQSFSIGSGETTRFIQQNAQSSVLNRIVGQDPSLVLGALQSNGRVFLINPNGIVFGAGARVDVNGLVASSLKLSNQDFAAGRLDFTADNNSGAVHNQGTITTPSGGQVYLIAPNVTNSGLISSPGGDVLLAAGRSVQIADTSDPSMRVVLSATNDQALNVGDIITQGGKVGIYGALVRQRGLVSANSAVRGENGQIVFKASGDAVLESGSVTSTSGGAISIRADNAVQVGGTVSSNGGAISLSGETVSIAGSVNSGGGALTITRKTFATPQDEEMPLPTLDQCIANPSLAGCSAVLPSIGACIAEPALAACSVVLPSLSTCVAAPSTLGCSVVLPSLSTCTANPATPGCSVVLPSINACVANPAAAGCSAVLPTINMCLASPTAIGCNVVLPSLSACTANPTAAGCSVVLPALSACVANPSMAGCSAVLPTLGTCVANPSAAGCTAVLPTLAACTATPNVAGCSAVLPSLSMCTAQPTLAGCSAVLPTLAMCVATPSAAGCAVVLPPIDQCVANPSLVLCAAVSPTVANSPVNQALNTTVNIINTVTSVNVTAPPLGGTSGASGTPVTPPADTKTADKTADEKKDDRKELVATEKIGAKNDDAAKKMYCN